MRSTLTGNKNLDIEILNLLNDRDLVSFCKTSTYANQLCNDQILWHRRTIGRFGFIPLETLKKYKGDRSWSEYYIELSTKIRSRPIDVLEYQSNVNKLLVDSSRDGRLDLVILALKKGAYIHVVNDLALINASGRGHLDVVKYLLDKGADIHGGDDWALIWASYWGHLEVVKYLVEKGADIHAKNKEALRWASRKGYSDIVKYLEEQMIK